MIDSVRYYFEYTTSKAVDKSWNINKSQYPHIWQYILSQCARR